MTEATLPALDHDARYSSALVEKTRSRLDSFPLRQLREAGIWRDRSTYFLNIAYPSMQAMKEVDPDQILESSGRKDGRTVALYAHVPFCTAECYYCHYYKLFKRPSSQVDNYLDSLDEELEIQERRFGGLRAASVYVGGGTPSYMTPEQIDQFFTSIERHVALPEGIEISFEMHPESADDERLEVLQAHGVNRINIGVESFNDQLLTAENRRHTAKDARMAFQRTREAGFDNVNIDLIYGLKGQTVEGWEQTLNDVATLEPASTTMYYLRLKKGTPEYKLWKLHPETFPTDDDLLLMHGMNLEKMEGELKYIQRPVDWFIKDPSYFHTYQDHNWRKSDDTELLGIGPSAYSYVRGWQYYNVNDLERWQASIAQEKLPVWKGEYLTGDEPMRRTVMLGIKMGMDRVGFRQTYGVDVVDAFPDTWERMEQLGLVTIFPNTVDLTYTGKLFADEVGQQFYSESMKTRMAAIDPEIVSTTWPQFNL